MRKHRATYILLVIALLLLFAFNIGYGAVKIPLREIFNILFGDGQSSNKAWSFIILNTRIPQAVTALFGGASLAVSGLLLQTLFRNPLAGPSILGISDGANLGVAIIMLLTGGIGSIAGYVATVMAALAGAFAILIIIILFSRRVKSNVMLLIIGIMIGYIASSAISILNYHASVDKVHQYVMWGMGDFSSVSIEKLPFFSCACIVGLILSVLLIKPLNAYLLGEQYAENLGVNIKVTRMMILLCTGLLIAVVTAFCGPISFIGLAVPHIARLLLGTSNHNHLVPVTIFSGACIALLCNLFTVIPGTNTILPLNAITPIIGAPIVIYVIVNKKNIQYFN
ncbi:MAG: iron ABC transporter permease [Bacteroidales bacterium]|nr:iron ABC transporter permease [Bacteroidales bacterium]